MPAGPKAATAPPPGFSSSDSFTDGPKRYWKNWVWQDQARTTVPVEGSSDAASSTVSRPSSAHVSGPPWPK